MTVLLNIDVPDVELATTFYTAAFGLAVGRRFGSDFVELLGWPAPMYLLTKQAGTLGAGDDRRRYDRHWTPLHLDVVVDDVDAAVARGQRRRDPGGSRTRCALWTDRDAGRSVRARVLSAGVQRRGVRRAAR